MQSVCWKKETETWRSWARLLFVGYCLMMLWLLLFRRLDGGTAGLNLQPLDTVRRYLWVLRHSNSPSLRRLAGANLLGNVGLFLAWGVLLPVVHPKMEGFWRFFLCSALAVLAVELCQLFWGLGVCDVDDWLLNMTGILLGWLLWRSFLKRTVKKSE